MERLKHIKDTLMTQIEGQLGHLDCVDAEELGEVVDMVKDLEEAIYYCTITKAMEEKEKEPTRTTVYYTEPKYPMYPGPMGQQYPPYDRDMDRRYGRMYYDGQGASSNGASNGNMGGSSSRSDGTPSGNRYYTEEYDKIREREYPIEMRDRREGQSPRSRKMYMESKEMHHDKATQLQELERYVKELTHDLIEMVEDSSPEEKQYLGNRISALGSKITKLDD